MISDMNLCFVFILKHSCSIFNINNVYLGQPSQMNQFPKSTLTMKKGTQRQNHDHDIEIELQFEQNKKIENLIYDSTLLKYVPCYRQQCMCILHKSQITNILRQIVNSGLLLIVSQCRTSDTFRANLKQADRVRHLYSIWMNDTESSVRLNEAQSILRGS